MDSIVNAMLNLGWGTVPVGVASATTEKHQIGFTTLHECGNEVEIKKGSGKNGKPTPAKNGSVVASVKQVKFCPACNIEVDTTVKGYEISPGKYVVVTEEELNAIKPPDTKEIVVSKFVPRNNVTSVMEEKHYFLLPNKNALNSYGVLYQALAETKTAAIGTEWLWQRKEHPCAVYADQIWGVLMMVVLREAEDLVEADFSSPIPVAADKRLLKEMIKANIEGLELSDLVSAQRTKLDALLTAKIQGVEVPVIETPAAVPDLMESLRQSIEAEKSKERA